MNVLTCACVSVSDKLGILAASVGNEFLPSVPGSKVEPFIRLDPRRMKEGKEAFSLQTRWQSLHKTAGTAFLQSSGASPSRLPLPPSFLLPTFRAPDKLASGRGRRRRGGGRGRARGREVGGNKRRRNCLPESNSLKCCFVCNTNPRPNKVRHGLTKRDDLNSRLRIHGNGRRATKTVTVRKVC